MNFQARVNELLDNLESQTGETFKQVTASAGVKGLVAGWAEPCGTIVKFNQEAANKYPIEFDKTIIHEVAHAIDIQRNGHRKNGGKYIHHDQVFYDICVELGDPDPSRTHEYKLMPARIYKQFEYLCECGGYHTLKTPSHNKLQKGMTQWYKYRDCGGKIFKHTLIREIPRKEVIEKLTVTLGND